VNRNIDGRGNEEVFLLLALRSQIME